MIRERESKAALEIGTKERNKISIGAAQLADRRRDENSNNHDAIVTGPLLGVLCLPPQLKLRGGGGGGAAEEAPMPPAILQLATVTASADGASGGGGDGELAVWINFELFSQ